MTRCGLRCSFRKAATHLGFASIITTRAGIPCCTRSIICAAICSTLPSCGFGRDRPGPQQGWAQKRGKKAAAARLFQDRSKPISVFHLLRGGHILTGAHVGGGQRGRFCSAAQGGGIFRMRNLFLLELLFQQRPHTLPLALMQTAQTSVRDGSGAAIHAAGRQVVWCVMCVGKIG